MQHPIRFLLALTLPLSLALTVPASAQPPGGGDRDEVALGRGLVEHLGCLFCHGLGGRDGLENPNAKKNKYVPAWDDPEFIERYPTSEKVAETIREGRFPEKDPAATSNPIPMPPWGNRLTDREMEAIIGYIWSLRKSNVASHPKGGRWQDAELALDSARAMPLPSAIPQDAVDHRHVPPRMSNSSELAVQGRQMVEYLGCLHCHAVGDAQVVENPNAKRGEIPRWDDGEFVKRYGVEDGVRYVIEKGRMPTRKEGAIGMPVPMPPFGGMLSPHEMDAVVAYIWSLRQPGEHRTDAMSGHGH